MAGFGEKLQAELDAREMGARTLARLLDPSNVDQERRAIRRYLKGMTPRTANRERIEDALGLEHGSLEPDPEEDSLPVLLLGQVRDSMRPAWSGYDPAMSRLRGLATVGAPEGQLRDTIIGLSAAIAVGHFFYFGGRLAERDGFGDNLRGAAPALPSRSVSRVVVAA